MSAGLIRIGEVARRITTGEADRGVAHATSGPCLQQNMVVRPGGRTRWRAIGLPSSVSGRRVHRTARKDVSMAGLVREAAQSRRSTTRA